MRRESHVRFSEGGGVRLPSATRLVRSIKEECLNRVVVLGEAHLRRTLTAFAAHYHGEPIHQGLHDRRIAPERLPPPDTDGPVRAVSSSALSSSRVTVRSSFWIVRAVATNSERQF